MKEEEFKASQAALFSDEYITNGADEKHIKLVKADLDIDAMPQLAPPPGPAPPNLNALKDQPPPPLTTTTTTAAATTTTTSTPATVTADASGTK
jgi:hypothetical protein